ncbi:hypothetical protein PBCVCan184_812L [Paramecium bursaria Chlorella virus Can18-4]|nr:hypothetical protein PBCVCan184_812L [Paramecium bursaria Chlorella virus Can18-4]
MTVKFSKKVISSGMDTSLDKIQMKLQAYIPYIQKLEDKVIALADENRNLKNELESYKKKTHASGYNVDMK